MKHKIKKYREVYFDNYFGRHISLTTISFFINLCTAFVKLLLGIVVSSYWFIITACYYIMLSITRGHLLYSYYKMLGNDEHNKNYEKQFSIYHRSGFLLIAIGLSYLVLCVCMYSYNQQSTYPEYILYGVVAIAFYKIGNAIYGLFQIKNKNSPILSMIKILGMIDACVSIVSVQCYLLTMQQSEYASSSSALFGMAFSLFFMTMGILTVRKKPKNKTEWKNFNS